MTEEKPLEEIEIVYLGKRGLKAGKTGYAFIALSTLEKHADGMQSPYPQDLTVRSENTSSIFGLSKAPCNSVGGVYLAPAEVREDGRISTIVVGKLQWKRRLPTPLAGLTAAWTTLNDAVELDKRRQSAEKNSSNDLALDAALKTLQDRYRRIPAGYKRGFKLWLLDTLEKR